MGVVYRALDIRLSRIVALKTLAEARHATRDQLARFLDEAKAVARLRHPNIIAIHAIGEREEQPYFSLEYAEGGNLARSLAKGPMASRQAAELVELLARAVHSAHRAGIIHRDLKPSNVLLTAEGVPKVGDFGLAKLLDGHSSRTYSGQVMGTPSYMAPEQAEGRSREVGPAADVYALGAILYHAMTGRPPFQGDSALETLKMVAASDAVPPNQLRPDVPRDLETICLKCLEKSPSRRYNSALELAEDLRRFLEDRPILARPVGAAGRLWRWAWRNRMLAAAASILVAVFALGTPGFFALWLGARADRARAIKALSEAQDANRQADDARGRAERSRDRALSSIRTLVMTEWDDMLAEELRPYRRLLTGQGLLQAQELVKALEGDIRAESQQVVGYLALAAAQAEAGETPAAKESGRKALDLAEALADRDPTAASRELLGTVLHRLCNLTDDSEAHRGYARRSSVILESLATQHPGQPDHNAHIIALNYHNIGHTYFYDHRPAEAIAAFEAGVRYCQEQIRRGDRSDPIQLDLARNLVYLCRVERTSDRVDDAIDAGKRAIPIYRAILDREPANYSVATQLCLAHEELGFAYQAPSRWADVIACHEAARATLKAAAGKHGGLVSRMAAIQAQLAQVDFNLSLAYASDPARYYRPMREAVAESYAICDKLELVQPLSIELRMIFASGCYEMAGFQVEDGLQADLELYERSERLWNELVGRIPGNVMCRAGLALVRIELADELEARGRTKEARACRQRSLDSVRGDVEILFQLALNYALNSRLIGTYPIKLDARRQQDRRRMFALRAFPMLREAIAAGYRDIARLWKEPELIPLQADPEFMTIASALDDQAFPADPFVPPSPN